MLAFIIYSHSLFKNTYLNNVFALQIFLWSLINTRVQFVGETSGGGSNLRWLFFLACSRPHPMRLGDWGKPKLPQWVRAEPGRQTFWMHSLSAGPSGARQPSTPSMILTWRWNNATAFANQDSGLQWTLRRPVTQCQQNSWPNKLNQCTPLLSSSTSLTSIRYGGPFPISLSGL